jgi:hypothetical protein
MAKQTFTTGQVLTAAQMTSLQQTAMGGGSTTAKTTSYTLVAADAGTVVQMNSASATTITVNTALFAAGDTVQIQNVGAGVCTVTAGTATVSTSATLALKQYDAGTLYFNTTSAAIFFAVDAADGMTNPFTTTGDTVYASGGTTPTRLGIGSTGQVLTVASGIPSWATPATASSGLVCIKAETAFSAVSSFTVDSIFTSTYTNYVLAMRYRTSTTNNPAIQLRVGGVTAATAYNVEFLTGDNTTVSAARITAQTSAPIFRSTDGDFKSYSTLQISGPYLAEATLFAVQSAISGDGSYAFPISQQNIANHSTATSYDGFIVSVPTGTFTGSYTLYGYSKAV